MLHNLLISASLCEDQSCYSSWWKTTKCNLLFSSDESEPGPDISRREVDEADLADDFESRDRELQVWCSFAAGCFASIGFLLIAFDNLMMVYLWIAEDEVHLNEKEDGWEDKIRYVSIALILSLGTDWN